MMIECAVDGSGQLDESGSFAPRTIARSSGFSSMRTFRRVFKKRFGMPPSEVHERLARSGGRDAFYHECIKKLSENWVFNSSRRYEESEEMAANLDRKNCILPKP